MKSLIGNLSVNASGQVMTLSQGKRVGDKMKYSDDSLVKPSCSEQ